MCVDVCDSNHSIAIALWLLLPQALAALQSDMFTEKLNLPAYADPYTHKSFTQQTSSTAALEAQGS